MCRWLAYVGEPLLASTVILDAQHSLVAQSLNSPLGHETVNGDGFGFGWYPEESAPHSGPAFFHSIEPAWNDENLRELTRSVRSPLFFSHVRAAAGPPIQRTNCHPFRHENWMFMHNGALDDFEKSKRDLTFAVDPSLYPEIRGTTDSEVLFHLALTLGLKEDPIAAMEKAVRMVESVGHDHGIPFPMQGTVAVTDGVTIWAFRYSSARRTRTLFHSVDIDILREMYPDAERLTLFGSHARLVVSEPLNDLPGVFTEVPESTVAIVDAEGYRYQPFLDAA
ncbi:class II glutamine amidotransferase [Salinibacterium hongtaonis]|uniref:Class II glutamine amidotransferase n=1 Tax=Homoserinimonas hongtaonis TaxID=2079791 RepID=A0A2U1SYW7_9MICO|nr:class II glutamine amidotransferase [Salinibacterium hongtaonis]AWB89373.1 class II glutamine amidotransferase [Salinibacterium hongtaonis]PWB96821.1 class II glutamine amidotransferase [Salinibacterium hongtaonis]